MSESEAPKWSRWLLPVGLAVVVIVLTVIALARGPADLDPDSPEGTVQEYLLALEEDRWDDALEVVHPQWRGACQGDDLAAFPPGDFRAELGHEDTFSGGFSETFSSESGVFIEGLPEPDAQVDVTIVRGTGGGLAGGWSEFVVFELVDEDEFWWISGDPWPYFVWSCQS